MLNTSEKPASHKMPSLLCGVELDSINAQCIRTGARTELLCVPSPYAAVRTELINEPINREGVEPASFWASGPHVSAVSASLLTQSPFTGGELSALYTPSLNAGVRPESLCAPGPSMSAATESFHTPSPETNISVSHLFSHKKAWFAVPAFQAVKMCSLFNP